MNPNELLRNGLNGGTIRPVPCLSLPKGVKEIQGFWDAQKKQGLLSRLESSAQITDLEKYRVVQVPSVITLSEELLGKVAFKIGGNLVVVDENGQYRHMIKRVSSQNGRGASAEEVQPGAAQLAHRGVSTEGSAGPLLQQAAWRPFAQKPPSGVKDLTEELAQKYTQADLERREICLGREEDLKQIMNYLGTTVAPPNLLIAGASGCGKTILMRELARKILVGDVPPHLQGYHIYDVSSHFNDFNALMEFVKSVNGKAILLFDECHNLFDDTNYSFFSFRGRPSEQMKSLMHQSQAAPMIMLTDRPPASLRDDPALLRRHFTYNLAEVSFHTAVSIIKNNMGELCQNLSVKCGRKISFAEDFIELAVKLSMAFLPNELLPGKAYRLLEPAILSYSSFGRPGSDPLTIKKEALYHYIQNTLRKTEEEIDEKVQEIDALLSVPIPPHEPLVRMTRNLTLEARAGKLKKAWGREELLENISVLLHASEGNNVMLTGPAGAGKSRIAEGLACLVAEGRLPDLGNVEVLLLNVAMLQQSGSFASFIASAEKYKKHYVLIIDEAHRLAANFQDFKEAWGRGAIPTVLMTTEEESALISADAALERRFSRLYVKPFSLQETTNLLLSEEISAPNVSPAAKEAIVLLSNAYYPRESQPSAALKALAQIQSYADFRRNKRVLDPSFVIEAIAYLHHLSKEKVEETLREERAALHPLTQQIPQGTVLKSYCDDLTREGLLGRIPNYSYIDSRQRVLDEMSMILQMPECNNIILEGAAGTGKTTLVKELAKRITEGNVPDALKDKTVLSLTAIDQLLANDALFAQFSREAECYSGKFILFVDECHRLLPYLEKLKPLLSAGHLRLIGATTVSIAHMLARDEALAARFAHINLPTLKFAEALDMLKAGREALQNSLQKSLKVQTVKLPDEALAKALTESEAKNWPRSAVMVLQKSASTLACRSRTNEIALKAIDILSTAPRAPLAPRRVSCLGAIFSSLQRAVSWVAYPFISASSYFFRRCMIRSLLKV